jgi:hypothetical protein
VHPSAGLPYRVGLDDGLILRCSTRQLEQAGCKPPLA